MKKLSEYKKIEVTNHTQTKMRVTVCEEDGTLYIWIYTNSGSSKSILKEDEAGIYRSPLQSIFQFPTEEE